MQFKTKAANVSLLMLGNVNLLKWLFFYLAHVIQREREPLLN